MRFYRLTHPYYQSDREENAANPVLPMRDVWLPGIICSACGSTWAGSRRLYLPVSDERLRRCLRGGPVPEPRWLELVAAVRRTADLPNDLKLMPGDVLGRPIAELLATELPDFIHPFPGQLIVTAEVLGTLQHARLTGLRPVLVESRWSKKIRRAPEIIPDLYELLVTGGAWRVGIDARAITVCQHCGRTVFPNPDHMVIDEQRWDGSDFFHVDQNPNIVLVSERVCEILADHHFANYVCAPLPRVPNAAS